MKFASGEGLKGYKFTVRPAGNQVLMDQHNRAVSVAVKPLRVVFDEDGGYGFDSVKAQEKYNWTDEERQEVEEALLDPRRNPYLNSQNPRRTIYSLEKMEETRETGEQLLDRFETKLCKSHDWNGDTGVACTRQVVPGTEFCEIHTPPSS